MNEIRALNDQIDAFWAEGDMRRSGAYDLALPALPMRPTVRVPLEPLRECAARLESDLAWHPGMAARPRRAWRAFDEEAIIPDLVTAYHDYPYGNIDQIDARNCA